MASEKGESGSWMKSERCKKYEGEKRGVGDREKKKDQKTDADMIFVKPYWCRMENPMEVGTTRSSIAMTFLEEPSLFIPDFWFLLQRIYFLLDFQKQERANSLVR